MIFFIFDFLHYLIQLMNVQEIGPSNLRNIFQKSLQTTINENFIIIISYLVGHVLLKYIQGQKDVEIASPQLSTASINVKFFEDPDWTEFKFITKKKGAQGPTKEECKDYYTDWYVNNYHSPYFKFEYF